jgi:hypothetical protein
MEVAWDCDLVPTYLPRELDQMVNICGFDDAAYEIIKIMRLDARFPNYRSRQDAVVGNKPA